MQLIIESESIDVNMSALDESQDLLQINAVMKDVKKDINTMKNDLQVLKRGTSVDTEEKELKYNETEANTNGDVEISNVNGKDSSGDEDVAQKTDVTLEEESVDNITNDVNSLFGTAMEDVNSDNSAGNGGNDSMFQTDEIVDNDLDNEEPPSTDLFNKLSSNPTSLNDTENKHEQTKQNALKSTKSKERVLSNICDTNDIDANDSIECVERESKEESNPEEVESNKNNHKDNDFINDVDKSQLKEFVSTETSCQIIGGIIVDNIEMPKNERGNVAENVIDKKSDTNDTKIDASTVKDQQPTDVTIAFSSEDTASERGPVNDGIIVSTKEDTEEKTSRADTSINYTTISNDKSFDDKINDVTNATTIEDKESNTSKVDANILNKSSNNVNKNVSICSMEVDDVDIVPQVNDKDTQPTETKIASTKEDIISEKEGNNVVLVSGKEVDDTMLKEKTSHDDTPTLKPIYMTDEMLPEEKNVPAIEEKEMNITENDAVLPDKSTKNDADSVSISSMEVDEIEIIPPVKDNNETITQTSEVCSSQDKVIDILDQDPKINNVGDIKESNEDTLVKSPDNSSVNITEQINNKDETSDEDDIKIVEHYKTEPAIKEKVSETGSISLPVVCKLSNTLDILSDDEDEPPAKKAKIVEDTSQPEEEDKQCIDIDDDDDIVLIEDTKETPVELVKPKTEPCEQQMSNSVEEPLPQTNEKDIPTAETDDSSNLSENEPESPKEAVKEARTPLLPADVLKSAKKNLSEMTRDELEEFCILKIVESIVDRSSLSEIKKKIKTIEQNMEEYKKKAMTLTKQNRDLQVVLKSVQEEQKSRPSNAITPLKITRSVGMQVLMLDKEHKKSASQSNNTNTSKSGKRQTPQQAKSQKPQNNNQSIPVPKLIPASPAKMPPTTPPIAPVTKPQTPTNGIRNTPSPAQKSAEKRSRQSSTNAPTSNMTVDLTDDDPPAKVNKTSPVPPVRVVPSQNLMAPRSQTTTPLNPRKVFIPINGPGQTVILKNINQQQMGPRNRFPTITRLPPIQSQSPVRMPKICVSRHPAPLPDAMKQYQSPNWKALPPAPDLKLVKVDNGIVISWKIEGYQEDCYEKIASYQLYAYQETKLPPSTALWKKIGDVKALPLPMACTLTQFIAGYKYYFAVRAVDVKSRLGPFSMPGSILLLNKM